MKIFLIILILALGLYAEDELKPAELDINNSFITKYEYGKMLFNNPRGIGCNNCHGDDARGKKLVDFKHTINEHTTNNKKEFNCSLVAPDIKFVDYDVFSKKVNSKKNENLKFEKEQVCDKLIYQANVMPTYFLVEDEIEAIYYYIQNMKEQKINTNKSKKK